MSVIEPSSVWLRWATARVVLRVRGWVAVPTRARIRTFRRARLAVVAEDEVRGAGCGLTQVCPPGRSTLGGNRPPGTGTRNTITGAGDKDRTAPGGPARLGIEADREQGQWRQGVVSLKVVLTGGNVQKIH